MRYMKKTLKMVLSSLICASLIITPVFATPEEEPDNIVQTEPESPDENGHYSVEYTHDIEPETNSLKGWPKGPYINSESAILMDMDTKEILYSKNPYKKQYPASITKLLTVLVALDYVTPDDTVEFTQASIDFLSPGDAHIAMRPGEIISMKDALYAVLYASANEVSYAVAENVGNKYLNGGYDEFIQKMNEKSEELGCTNSHWANANGLHDKDHYTSAYDMALIGAEIYKNPVFNEMMEGFEHVIPPTNLVDEQRVFQQHHKMTWKQGKYYYPYCKGGKTGYTDDAQTTLVTLADNGERKLVAVILYDRGGEAYNQTRELFDYGYDMFKKVIPEDVNTNKDIDKFLEPSFGISLPDGVDFDMLDSKVTADEERENRGTVVYTYNENPMGVFDVKITRDAYDNLIESKSLIPEIDENNGQEASELEKTFIKEVKIVLIVITAFVSVVLLIFFIRLHAIRRRKRARSRRKKNKKKTRR